MIRLSLGSNLNPDDIEEGNYPHFYIIYIILWQVFVRANTCLNAPNQNHEHRILYVHLPLWIFISFSHYVIFSINIFVVIWLIRIRPKMPKNIRTSKNFFSSFVHNKNLLFLSIFHCYLNEFLFISFPRFFFCFFRRRWRLLGMQR